MLDLDELARSILAHEPEDKLIQIARDGIVLDSDDDDALMLERALQDAAEYLLDELKAERHKDMRAKEMILEAKQASTQKRSE